MIQISFVYIANTIRRENILFVKFFTHLRHFYHFQGRTDNITFDVFYGDIDRFINKQVDPATIILSIRMRF